MRIIITTIGFALLLAAHGAADEVKTIDGKASKGALEKITDKEIILKAGSESQSTPLAKVLDVNLRPGNNAPAAAKYTEVRLVDDSVLRCVKVTFGQKEVKLDLTSGVSVKVPFSALFAVLRDAQDANLKRQFDTLTRAKQTRDRIFSLRGDSLNPISVRFGAMDEAKQSIKFTPEGLTETELPIEKFQGIQFVRTDAPTEASLCRVIDVDGNVLVAAKLAYAGGPLDITTPFGFKVALDAKAVARLDFNFGRLTYLSDLNATLKESPLFGGFNPVRKDANLDGYPIMLMDKKYDKGLSMYAGAEVEFDLGGKYKQFKAVLGVDARIAEEGQGKVTVTVYCGRDKRGEYAVSTQKTIPIAIDVKDAQTLRIVVSGPNFTNLAGHATLANAQVSQ